MNITDTLYALHCVEVQKHVYPTVEIQCYLNIHTILILYFFFRVLAKGFFKNAIWNGTFLVATPGHNKPWKGGGGAKILKSKCLKGT
jgi:hypothetical protein